jgi:hypothetical protein
MHIDKALKWGEHINILKRKISKSQYAINKARFILSRKQLNTLYYSMVYPYLLYGIILWGSTYDSYLSKLEIQQKKIIRAIAGARYDAHSEPLFKSLNILKLHDIYNLQVAKYVYAFIQNTLPPQFSNIFTLSQDAHTHDTRHSRTFKLALPKTRTTIANNSITKMGPKIWNSVKSELYTNPHNNTMISTKCFSMRYRRHNGTRLQCEITHLYYLFILIIHHGSKLH